MELMEIAALVDQYDSKRDERLLMDKEAAKLKREEQVLHDRILHELNNQGMMYVAGTYKRVKVNPTIKHVAEDWDAVYRYMANNDSMDLVQKRLHEGAIILREEEGLVIPGLTIVEVNKLSIAKI
jgi:hypothetical protein